MNRPFRPSQRRWWVTLLLVAAVVLLRWFSPAPPKPLPDQRQQPPATAGGEQRDRNDGNSDELVEGDYTVQRVVDGDTLLLTSGERVRLLAVNSPESVRPDHPVEAWGEEASDFTRQFIGKQQVRLTFDREKFDQHDRYLAYVWVADKLLNEELARAGLAKVNTHYDNDPAIERRLKKAEDAARRDKRGIWSQVEQP